MTLASNSNPHSHFLWLWFKHTSPGGWTEYRRLSSNEEAWFQRILESWWILRGQWSLSKSYKAALTRKSVMMKPEDLQSIVEKAESEA
jgi:hypothetical protein